MIVSASFHFVAGQAKAVAGLADYLARTGTQVHLVGMTFDESFNRDGVTIHKVAQIPGADVIGNLFLARKGQAVARRLTRENRDVRVVVNGGNCSWADINWVHYLHHAWLPDLSAAPWWFRLKERTVVGLYRRWEKLAIRAARLILTNSKQTTSAVINTLGVPTDRVRTVYYGANPSWKPASDEERHRSRDLFGLHPTRPIVVFVAGFGHDNRKGFDTMLEAWRRVCQAPNWDADLVMAGGGKATDEIGNWITRNGLANRISMVGFTSRVFDLLAASDLLVSPVRYEPYGLNVQEAVCRGVPALVSTSAGVAEEYPPELADMLIPNPDDAEDLAARLRAWRANVPEWKARFRDLSERLRSRTWDDMAREIVFIASAARQ